MSTGQQPDRDRHRELVALVQAAAPVPRPHAERIADALTGHHPTTDPNRAGDLRPLDVAPVSIHPPYDQRRPLLYDLEAARRDFLDALRAPLAGLVLGAYDIRILGWLAGWDHPTVGTVASLLHRARAADPLPTRTSGPGGRGGRGGRP